jgi:cyclopropane-fatty-acyl-phospholipid synthase
MNREKKAIIMDLLSAADVHVNGARAWDIQVHDERFYEALLRKKNLGLGESYMAGWWDCDALDQCVARLIKNDLQSTFKIRPVSWLQILACRLFNFQTKRLTPVVAKQHYDVGNDLFQRMLDKNRIYSCGYWKRAENLDQSQLDKLELICKKLELAPGMRLLDIGCGFGGLAKYAAENYGVKVVGITISKEQAQSAIEYCEGLPVKIYLQDYRELKGQFDRIASIGMFEHVGYKNYRCFMQIAKRCLTKNGLFLLHTMGSNYSVVNGDEWLNKYIFPNGMLPSIKQLGRAFEEIFIMEDWHNFGMYYYPTLVSWHQNFNQNWKELKLNYSEEFRRMWNFYLLGCAGAALARRFQVWQIVFSNSRDSTYRSYR